MFATVRPVLFFFRIFDLAPIKSRNGSHLPRSDLKFRVAL